MSIVTLYDSDSTEMRCMRLIERHAPRLMREGGGALSREVDGGERKVVTWRARSRILTLRRDGYSPTEIGEAVGFSEMTIYRVCHKAGVGWRKRCGISARMIAKIFELRAEGWPVRVIAAKVGCSVSAVDHRVRKWRKAAEAAAAR